MFIPNIDLKSFEEMLQEWSDWWYDLGDWEVAAPSRSPSRPPLL